MADTTSIPRFRHRSLTEYLGLLIVAGLVISSIAATAPELGALGRGLERLVAPFLNEDMLEAVAARHGQGRRLLVATTDYQPEREAAMIEHMLRQRVADQALGQSVFGVAALLAQGGQKLLELVAFLGGHEQVPSWVADGLALTIMGSRLWHLGDGPMRHQVFCRYT